MTSGELVEDIPLTAPTPVPIKREREKRDQSIFELYYKLKILFGLVRLPSVGPHHQIDSDEESTPSPKPKTVPVPPPSPALDASNKLFTRDVVHMKSSFPLSKKPSVYPVSKKV